MGGGESVQNFTPDIVFRVMIPHLSPMSDSDITQPLTLAVGGQCSLSLSPFGAMKDMRLMTREGDRPDAEKERESRRLEVSDSRGLKRRGSG